MSAIEITRQDLSISQLRAEAARTADAKQARRILAIAMVLDGHSRLLEYLALLLVQCVLFPRPAEPCD